MNKEVWKSVIGYDDEYQISNFGRLKTNKKRSLIMKPDINEKGYHCYSLYKGKSKFKTTAHREVYRTFVGEIKKGYSVDHIDENKNNNCSDNLQLLSNAENVRKHHYLKRGRVGVRESNGRFFVAKIVDGKQYSLGGYSTQQEAQKVYFEFKGEL